MVTGFFFFFFWLWVATLQLDRFLNNLLMKTGKKRQEQCDGKENVDKRVVESGRVGERAKEALVDGLGWLVMACSI